MNLVSEPEYLVEEKEDDQGRLLKRTWRDPRSGRPHRIDGPAILEFDPETGAVIREAWMNYHKGGHHREDDLPAEIRRWPKTGVVMIERYYRRGQLHRDGDKPAEIYRDSQTGQINGLIYCVDGDRFREGDRPAVQEFDPVTGALTREEFYHEGKLHRDHGPAILDYDVDGKVIHGSLQYFRNGRAIPPQTGIRLDMP